MKYFFSGLSPIKVWQFSSQYSTEEMHFFISGERMWSFTASMSSLLSKTVSKNFGFSQVLKTISKIMPNDPSEPKNNSIRFGPVASFAISFCSVRTSPLASRTFIRATCSFVDP